MKPVALSWIWHGCVPLPAKTITVMELSHSPVFYFLRKLPNGREIFRTIISSAGKSYDGLQKYRKSVQADCTPMTQRTRKESHVTYMTHWSSEPTWQPCFSATWSSPPENSCFLKNEIFRKYMPLCKGNDWLMKYSLVMHTLVNTFLSVGHGQNVWKPHYRHISGEKCKEERIRKWEFVIHWRDRMIKRLHIDSTLQQYSHCFCCGCSKAKMEENCYGLSWVPPNSYDEALTPNVTIFEG